MSKNMLEIDVAELRSIMWCDPKTGVAYWYPRAGEKAWNTRFAGKPVGGKNNERGTYKFGYKNKKYPLHRAIYAMINGAWPEYEIDHINGNPSDNRIENLRDVPHKLNMRNTKLRKNNRSGSIGVQHRPERNKPWIARCKVDGIPMVYESFYTKEEAEAVVAEFRAKNGFHENHGRKVA